MKNQNIKIILIALIAAALGLGAGYVIFNKKTIGTPESQDGHNHTTSSNSEGSSGEEQIWTCSMHPQVQQNEPGLCPLCEMDLIPLESNTSSDPLVLQMTEDAVKLANIQTTVIGQSGGSTDQALQLSGKVQADERQASSQVSHVPGRIEKLFVTFTGEQVSKGQKIATIYSPELISAQRELLEALRLYDLNPSLLQAARNKLRYWKVSDSVIEAVEQEGKIREYFTVFADASGIVTNRRISVGDYVKQGESLFDLMNLNKVWVLFDAYEENLKNIKKGDQIEFTTPALPNRTFKTRITFIDPLINPNTRVASIRTEVNNSGGLLKPEMFVKGILMNKKRGTKSQLAVPKSAVMWTGKRSVVYVKVPDMDIPSFKFKEVELGESIGNSYQVVSGLDAGDEVVTNGSFTIDAAAQLNNQASMMNREVSLKKEDSGATPNFVAVTPDEFKTQINDLANAYIGLKDAFVATDATIAKEAAKDFLTQLEKVDMSLVKDEAHVYWMEQLTALEAHGRKITEMDDVEDQRKQFGFLSEALINTITAFGTKGQALYVQHCPMAFNNKGGDWLAVEEGIRNPYFGDKMMKCGLVKKTFLVE